MKSVKFLRNVAVYGVHRERGTIHDIEDRDAIILIADGAADEFVKPAKVIAENAESIRPPKETADRKHK